MQIEYGYEIKINLEIFQAKSSLNNKTRADTFLCRRGLIVIVNSGP